MAKKDPDQRIAELQERRDKLNEQIKQQAAKKAQQQRKQRNGQLVAAGILVEEMLKAGAIDRANLVSLLNKHMTQDTRNRERVLSMLDRLGFTREEDEGGNDGHDGSTSPEGPGSPGQPRREDGVSVHRGPGYGDS